MRRADRKNDELREIQFIPDFTIHGEGSVLSCFGNTKVLCTASVEEGVPRFLRGEGRGWITAEYGMLPRSTHTRSQREAARGKQSGRTQEIQRLIGRSLRAAVNLEKLGEYTITFDCDVLQADGGTRTAAITGAYIALERAIEKMLADGLIDENPIERQIAAISVGIVEGEPMLDLDYPEDSRADTDMNIIMDHYGNFIELQATAEEQAFSAIELKEMLALGEKGINELFEFQREVL